MTSETPFFSIIVPCCDVEPYVRECLMSVINQSFKDWECIIGIETCKDRTEDVIHKIIDDDDRFKVFTGPRSGSCSASRNTGIDMAQGKYVIFLDGDDTIVDGSLQRLHDKIVERPGADIYPCAIQVYDEKSGKNEELRDNYPLSSPRELTGPEATIYTASYGFPCPMLQMTVFLRDFLIVQNLRCLLGLRRQDSEFSPRALYLAKRVIPLHEPFYIYRKARQGSVSVAAHGEMNLLQDHAYLIKSLLSFHAKVSQQPNFDIRVSKCWGQQWMRRIFYLWFAPDNIKASSRAWRVETLSIIFAEGDGNFKKLEKATSFSRRIAGWCVCAYAHYPFLRGMVEMFFFFYFGLSKVK